MSDNQARLEETIRQATVSRTNLQKSLEDIFLEEFGLIDEKQDAGYKAWATLGVDVSVRLARMFIGLKNNTGLYETMCDLIYQLSTNDLWQKNASILIPVMHTALNAYRDGVALTTDRVARDEYSSSDALISAARVAPLEIFPVIAYIVGGPQLMTAKSLVLKQRLAPYFL